MNTSNKQTNQLIKDIFVEEAAKLGYTRSEADELLKEYLPLCFHNLEIQGWGLSDPPVPSYIYGELFNVHSRPAFGSPYNSPPLSNLIKAYFSAKKYLSHSQFNTWSGTAASKVKHMDALTEMIAIQNVDPAVTLHYESIGIKKIDWLLQNGKEEFLLEVKNRPGMVAKHLERISKMHKSIPYETTEDMGKLFSSTYNKFDFITNSKYIQGVSLFTSINVHKTQVESYFLEHLQDKFHFVAFASLYGTHVNILSTSDEIKDKVLSAFGWIDDAYFLMSDIP
jgi:hypothetical protein